MARFHGPIVRSHTIAIEDLPQGGQGLHDGACDQAQEKPEEPRVELRKSIRKVNFHSVREFTEEYNSIWPQKCGGGSDSLNFRSLIKGKDFDDNVEAHESTCDTRPAGGAGASEYNHGDDGTGFQYEHD